MVHKVILSKLHRTWKQARLKTRHLEVFALVGKAGTGKSFRARLVANSHQIDCIIDDGLLIHKGKIIAGESAKHKARYFTAVKTAIFHNLDHRRAVQDAIQHGDFNKILLLGTSEKMIRRNCETLNIPQPIRFIKIEEIATEEEIALAIHDRKTYGKHIIPLPIIEVKQAYPRMVAKAVQVWCERSLKIFGPARVYDKTVVRPRYHKHGDITISEAALTQMLLHCINEKSPSIKVRKIQIKPRNDGYDVTLRLNIPFGLEIAASTQALQHYIIDQIKQLTGIQIHQLALRIDTVHHKGAKSS
ncbi:MULTISPECIES: hypothetical protein [unclassified Lentimonas]|uniref:hypothetical protein n=1 Tax=unclassified Lentimonas TaxID=2630993 RepID=UPI00132A9CAF|nr:MULTISPECIES: hypothetical protein [unclassified Lentimonas]CAA6685227.1 Unannotated [Lentimonas sp. CC6]CAA7182072.1 Unannotated [Lentimonas sp. CC8]CAA6676388.1 Unannotated [Lentimonas sp. CC4]CAA7075048.1 Unannotated [Lentimonas sp. CC4]CAA7169647.1 Unannotated [Lentimonas sp. CC21]